MRTVHCENHRKNNREVADILHVRHDEGVDIACDVFLDVSRKDIEHQHIENIKLEFVVVRKIRQNRQQEKDEREKTQEKTPRNARSTSPDLHLENALPINFEHFPKRNAQERDVQIVEIVVDSEEEFRSFKAH